MKEIDKIKEIYQSGIPVKGISIMTGIKEEKIYEALHLCPVPPLWTNEPQWRRSGRERVRYLVRRRDGFTCQDCGVKWEEGNRHFDVHHLQGLCGKRTRKYDYIHEMKGLVTLCHKCHYNRPEHKVKQKDFTGGRKRVIPSQGK